MTLTKLPPGTDAKVISVTGEDRITRRLMEMGVIPGVSIKVLKTAPLGDPMEVRVRGYSLAMRKNEAEGIKVAS